MITRTKLYGGEVEMLFDTFRHRYSVEGKKITSTTQATGIIDKPALINWAAKMAVEYLADCLEPGKSYDEIELAAMFESAKRAHWQKKTDAGNIGIFVHNWIEKYIKGENPGRPVSKELQRSIDQFLDWKERHDVKFTLSEQSILSLKYGYSGTLDFSCVYEGKMLIGDLKTSSGIFPEHLIQATAYKRAREEEFSKEKYEGILVVRIGKDGSFEIATVTDDKMLDKLFFAFIAALRLRESMDDLKNFRGDKK